MTDSYSADTDPESVHGLIGKQVEVVLDHGNDETPKVVAAGQLMAHNEWGEVVLLDEMGGLHFCWPRLAIREVSP